MWNLCQSNWKFASNYITADAYEIYDLEEFASAEMTLNDLKVISNGAIWEITQWLPRSAACRCILYRVWDIVGKLQISQTLSYLMLHYGYTV